MTATLDNSRKLKEKRLYELDRGAKIYGLEPDGDKHGVVIFDHLDGMYSYCYVLGHKDKIVHLGVTTEFVKHKDGWKLKEEGVM